jgi:Domain of unknown function (DUF4331)
MSYLGDDAGPTGEEQYRYLEVLAWSPHQLISWHEKKESPRVSHHYSGPDFGFPGGDARLDFTDLYVFPKSGDAAKSIVIADLHPSFGLSPRGPTPNEPFAPEALYELRVDTNGDLVADIAYRVRFAPDGTGGLAATVRRVEGPDAAGMGEGGEVIVQGVPVSVGRPAWVTEAGAYRFFAGWRSDPFFFDLAGVQNNFQFTGDDFFADKDVCSIALELPNSALGGAASLNLWYRVLVQADGTGSGWVQVERGARTNQTPFLASEARDAYLSAEPAHDERFVPAFAHALEHIGFYTPEDARTAARSQLPDVIRYDHSQPVKYPTNGRALTDDVVDYFLGVLTNGKVTADKVGPHTDLLEEFPYVGTPHKSMPMVSGYGDAPSVVR